MALDGIRYRPATPRDTTVVAELMAAGFATYRDFAAPGWQPRSAIQEEAEVHARLSRGDVHARLALAENGVAAGFTGWMPATRPTGLGERAPCRAHLWTLFVARAWWGTGLAADLLAWSVDGMRESGYECAQLWTPTSHARARAFYEREGWGATGEREFSTYLGLDLVLYETALA
jgi:GNAT superfamily N-acetyltransferase